jgi:hypothetical protein
MHLEEDRSCPRARKFDWALGGVGDLAIAQDPGEKSPPPRNKCTHAGNSENNDQ